MNLNKFEDEELILLNELIDKEIDFKRDFRNKTGTERMKNKLSNDIKQLELMSVKVNNYLGEFE